MRRFTDLRDRHDLRRIQRNRARHFLQSDSVQCRAEMTTAERSVILLTALPASREVVAARAGQQPAGERLRIAGGSAGQALAVIASAYADDDDEQTPAALRP